jgi:eukaryotic-like serine/threonine-protein kinase
MVLRPETGLEIDGFRLGAELHRGGFSTVWEVQHPKISAPMVMKVPRVSKGLSSASIVGFEVEQMIMPRLSGPHVPRLIGQGGFDPLAYIVTERIAGTSLQARIAHAPLALPEVLDLAQRLAQALHDLHRQSVIHLDLKPENLMQRPSGEVVFIDFGLSRHDALPDLLAEEYAIPLGTFPYIAPEQLLRQRHDLRSDLFAFGVMLYQMLTGVLPFGKPAGFEQARARLWQDPVPPRALRSDIPEWLQEITLRALEVDPEARYQSAAQLMFDLANPHQLRLTARGLKLARDPWHHVARRWWGRRRLQGFAPPSALPAQSLRAPHVVVALDLSPAHEDIAERVLHAAKQLLHHHPQARVSCVAVLPPEAGSRALAQLLALSAWGLRLGLREDRLSFVILQNSDAATALLEFCAANATDQILLGAGLARLGAVAGAVAAQARCSVSLIRAPQLE